MPRPHYGVHPIEPHADGEYTPLILSDAFASDRVGVGDL